MTLKPYLIFSVIILFSLQSLFAFEMETEIETEEQINITENESFVLSAALPLITATYFEAFIGGEYNRGNYNNGSVRLAGGIELFDLVFLKGGISFTQSTLSTDLDAFFNTRFTPFQNKYLAPLGFSVSYIYNGMLDLDIHTHSIFPMISYTAYRFGASAGLSFRFSSFFGEDPQFESVFSFYLYFNFVKTESLILGAACGTFDDFNTRNMAALWLNLNATIILNDRFSIYNKLEWMQSGLDGLSSTFYGISYKGGVKFSW